MCTSYRLAEVVCDSTHSQTESKLQPASGPCIMRLDGELHIPKTSYIVAVVTSITACLEETLRGAADPAVKSAFSFGVCSGSISAQHTIW